MDIMEPGYKMLGSTGTQYLNPDYIQPLSTTLDSKNSPLALLAQTCSSIGKDSSSSSSSSSSSKLPVPSLSDKKDPRDVSAKESSSAKHRSTSDSPIVATSGVCGSGRNGGEASRSTKSGEKSSKDGASCSRSSSSSDGGGGGGGGGGGEHSPKARSLHPLSRPLSSLVSLGGNGSGKCTPSANVASLHRDYAALRGCGGASVSSSGPSGISLPTSSAINNNKIFGGGDMSAPFDGYSDEMLKSSAAGLLFQQQSLQEALRLQHEGIQSLQAAAVGLGPLAPSGYPPLLFGHPLTAAALDPLMYSYSASLAAVHGLAMNSHKLPMLSPYMGYARVSTSSDGSALVPVCKDPFCATGTMPSTPHGLQAATGGRSTPCGAGCTQCGDTNGGHDKSQHRCTGHPPPPPSTTTTLAGGGGGLAAAAAEVGPSFLSSSSFYPMSLAPPGGGLVNPLLGMAAAAHLGVGLTPYACSWLSGGEFCGKRFSKADDLLQHLRTHASSSADPVLPAFPLHGLPLPTPGFVGGSGVGGHPFNIPGSLSPTSLLQPHGQSYPRNLSPNSLLSASRYHPYKPPFATLPAAAAVGGSTGAGAGGGFAGMASALDAYYSSHDALFGHRIGAAAVGP